MRWTCVLAAALVASPVGARGDADLDVRTSDGTLRARVVGEGAETVIVVHGGPGLTHEYLLGLARLGGETRRVVFYDQRGAGDSPRPRSGDYGLEAQVADLDAVRAAAGERRVHVLGHSWGTVVAIAYAVAHPDSVASLILVGMGAPTDAEDRRSFGAAFAARRARLVRDGVVPRVRPAADGDDCMAGFNASLPAHFADARHPGARGLAGTYRCDVARATLRAA